MTIDQKTPILAGSVLPASTAIDMNVSAASAATGSQSLNHRHGPQARTTAKRAREKIVMLSMALVTAASAATLYALLEFSLSSSVLCGGLIWAALMTLHLQMKKNAEITHLKAELARLEGARGGVTAEAYGARVDAAPGHVDPAQNPKGRSGGKNRNTIDAQRNSQTPSLSVPAPSVSLSVENSTAPQPDPRWEAPTGHSRAAPTQARAGEAKSAGGRADTPAVQPSVESALWPGTAMSASDPMRDQWAFRPKDTPQSNKVAAPAAQTRRSGEDHAPNLAPPNGTIDADLEMVQRKIKALADEVNAAELLRDRQPSAPSAQQAMAIEKSIGALKATADTMRDRPSQPQSHAPQASRSPAREPRAIAAPPPLAQPANSGHQSLSIDLMIPATAERIAVSSPDVVPELPDVAVDVALSAELPPLPLPVLDFPLMETPQPNPRLAAIIAAIENGEMDVFLSPIVALKSHQVSHYDVTVRIRNASGGYDETAEQELQLAGSDMLALFDTARLKRAAQLAQRLDAHNKSGSLLSAVNGPSITNAEFLETFARVYEERDRISNQLVLTFSQSDIEHFSPSAWQALSDMHAFGFRFALANIDHVSMDFAVLAQRGFAFLRLDANALTSGLPSRDRFVATDELCKVLAGAGMTLVADTIDDEAVRARVFGFGILFGQGRLFGGARQVKLDAIAQGSAAAA
jgi:cyclic-di-GMP phosphodiesterase, flagellum assembly factor TipF